MSKSRKDAPVNLAFLGCGAATRMHSRTLSRRGFRVRRFYASQEPRRARAFADRYGGGGWFHSYETAIRDPAVQVVLVATPPSSHLELTLLSLGAGKDVIVEKPAFLRSQDFDVVEAARARTGGRVFIAENYVYKPLTRRLREIIRSGALGEVRFIHLNALKEQSSTGWRGDGAVAGGGALFEGGIHWVSLLGSLGLDVSDVWGVRADPGPDLDRSFLVVFRYGRAAVGSLHYSWELAAPFRGVRISRIYGTEGSVLFESNGLFIWSRRAGGRGGRGVPRLEIPSLRDLAGYRRMFSDFLSAIRSGTAPEYTIELARRDLERVESAYRTSQSGSEQTLEIKEEY